MASPRIGELKTANYGWTKPTVGASEDAWGSYINADLDAIDGVVNSIQTSIPTVPIASTTQPLVNGSATAGSSPQWSRGDHVHPTDTSCYAASNPSGYQTAANVAASLAPYALTTSLANYLPLSGGALTGALTPSQTAGLVGTTTNNNANAGVVGESISSNVTTGVPLTTSGTVYNITSISLTAGDWDVSGEVWFVAGTGAPTAAQAGISVTSASLPGSSGTAQARSAITATLTASSALNMPLRTCRVTIASTTIYYLVAYMIFPSGAPTAAGNIIARRMR